MEVVIDLSAKRTEENPFTISIPARQRQPGPNVQEGNKREESVAEI